VESPWIEWIDSRTRTVTLGWLLLPTMGGLREALGTVHATPAAAAVALAAAAAGGYCCWHGFLQRAPSGTVLIFGVGYTGERVALKLREAGYRVVGTARSAASAGRLTAQLGIEVVVFDGTPDSTAGAAAAAALAAATHVLATAQPGEPGDPMLCNPVLKAALEARLATGQLCWLGYMSTVGVYGDTSGAPVTEDSPVNPRSARGKRRVVAEEQWRGLGGPLHIFRLPGIYGPGRGPLEKVRGGTARCLVKPNHKFSRIHVDDIAQVILASLRKPSDLSTSSSTAAVFNVTDDEPAASHEVTEHAARLLGVAPPPRQDFATADLSAAVRSFYAESRLLTNEKLKTELGVELRYPTYREGQAAQL
jgi:nucleoside-diphosphate-sugar epimerase